MSAESAVPETGPALPAPVRKPLPAERQAITHKFSIAGHEGYLTVGMYEDGRPGEIFLLIAKEGSTISGLMDSFATMVSLALQYGVPLAELVRSFAHIRYEPSGFTKNPEIPYAKSITDYVVRWLGHKFLSQEDLVSAEIAERKPDIAPKQPSPAAQAAPDAPRCHYCGPVMSKWASGFRCANCGSTQGFE